MFFILTPYRLVLKTNLVLTTATSIVIKYKGPYYESGQWTATAELKDAVFEISDTLIDRKGTYKMQVIAVIDGEIKRSTFTSVYFGKSL